MIGLYCIWQGDRSWNAMLQWAADGSVATLLRVWIVTKLLGGHLPCNRCSSSSWETGKIFLVSLSFKDIHLVQFLLYCTLMCYRLLLFILVVLLFNYKWCASSMWHRIGDSCLAEITNRQTWHWFHWTSPRWTWGSFFVTFNLRLFSLDSVVSAGMWWWWWWQ